MHRARLFFAGLAFFLAAAAFAVAVLVADDATPVPFARICLWTNLFFLWPAIRALWMRNAAPGYTYPAAWAEAGVFAVTFFASVIHHGCDSNATVRDALRFDTLWLLLIGAATMVTAVTVLMATWRRPADWTWQDARPSWCIGGAAVLAAAALAVGFGMAMAAASAEQLDGCLWPHPPLPDAGYTGTTAPALAKLWGVVDFVTAFAALVLAAIWLLQLTDTLTLAVFWLLAVLLLALKLMSSYVPGGLGEAAPMVGVAVAAALFLCCQLVVCCTYPEPVVQQLLARYDGWDLALAAVVSVVAVGLFLFDNTPPVHGAWHALGAAALYLVLESLYRDRSQHSWWFVAGGLTLGVAALLRQPPADAAAWILVVVAAVILVVVAAFRLAAPIPRGPPV